MRLEWLVKTTCIAVIGCLAAVAGSAPAPAHDCRVRDVAGYLRGGGYDGDCDGNDEVAQGLGEARGADTYVGFFWDGWPEGKGIYTWENGARLVGSFKQGKADGEGVYFSANGVRYRGQFVDGTLAALKPEDCPVTQGPLMCPK